MVFSKVIAVDETNNFPQPVRLAMANSAEVKALLDQKNGLTNRGYRAYADTDVPSKYPLGISNALVGTGDGWNFGNGQAFMNVITFRNSVYDGGTSQLAFPYSNNALPALWRVWQNGASAWGPWQSVVTSTALTTALGDYLPKWKPNTIYAAGQQVLAPNNDIVTAKAAHTSGATWNPANWNNVRDRMMTFSNSGFAWSAGANWDAGNLSIDTGTAASSQLSPNMNFAAPGSVSGALKFLEPGLYDVIWYHSPGGEVGNGGYRINSSGTWPGPLDGPNGVFGQAIHMSGQSFWETRVDAIGIRVPQANLEVRLTGAQTNASTCIPRVKVIQRERF